MKRHPFCSCLIFAVTAIALVGCAASPLYAWNRGAMLSPTRVVIEGRERAAVVKLINPDDQTNRYRISLINMRMDDLGNRRAVENPTPEEKAVIKMIRFSPRRATVGPKGWQTIRIMVRKPADLAPGEYRVHLKVSPMAPDESVNSGDTKAADKRDKEKMSVNLNVLFAITIPVIIRHGDGAVALTPEKPALGQLAHRKIILDTPLVRAGSHSALFDIFAYSLAGGERQKLGELKGFSFYAPNSRIHVQIPLDPNLASGLRGSPVELKIVDREKRKTPVSGSWRFVLD